MMHSIKHFFLLSGLLFSIFFLTGCPKQSTRPPTPEDTVAGSGYSERSDYIYGQNAYNRRYSEEDAPVARSTSLFDQKGAKAAIASVYFKFDNAGVDPSERQKLQTVSEMLTNNERMRILVVGHCDWHGTTEYNLALGERRAKSVKQYLVDIGCSPDQIETLSKGDLEASARGKPSETAKDRRGDIVVIQ